MGEDYWSFNMASFNLLCPFRSKPKTKSDQTTWKNTTVGGRIAPKQSFKQSMEINPKKKKQPVI